MVNSMHLLTVASLFLIVGVHSAAADGIVCQLFKPIPFVTSCTKPKWNQEGLTVAGATVKQESSSSQLSSPSGIFIDHYDNLFIADESNHRIVKISPTSTNVDLTIAGGNGQGSALNQLKEPRDVYVDAAGTVFIADRGNLRVLKYLPYSTHGITVASGKDYSGHRFQGLSGNRKQINEIHCSESIMGRGRMMSYPLASNGTSPSYATIRGSISNSPEGLAIDECDNVYIASPSDGNIFKFISGNSTGERIASGLITPNDVVLDTYGNIYVVERDTNRVQRLNLRDGTREVIAGNKDGIGGNDSEHLNKPWSIAFDSKNNLYVSDRENHRVQKFIFNKGDLFC